MATNTNRTILKQAFESENTFASTMVVALTDELGSVSWFAWEPESIRKEISDRFDAKVPQDNMDKIQGLVLAMTTNQFYVSLEAFIGICNSLGGDGADFRTFDPADVEEMQWAVTEVLLNDPQGTPLEDLFSEEIRHYIGVQAAQEGFKELPKTLAFGALDPEYDRVTEAVADPEMFSAYYSTSKEKVTTAEQENQEKLRDLVGQISRLPLQQIDSEAWKKFSGRAPESILKQSPPAVAGRHGAAPLRRAD